MLPFILCGNQGPLIVLLHWLGGSANTFTELTSELAASGLRCAALDLPGFGDAAEIAGFTIAATVENVTTTITSIRAIDPDAPWFVLGHSMGGKLAAILARSSMDGDTRLRGLRGVILVSPSPPGPEPMKESQREKLLKDLGSSTRDGEADRGNAERFVDANIGKLPLIPEVRERSARDILRANRAAFVAWLTSGSKEDWSERVGLLSVPAVVFAGTEEPSLGPQAQQSHTLPHFSSAQLIELQGGGHLAPLERPYELASRIKMFVEDLGFPGQFHSRSLGAAFRSVIESDRTSPQTRDVLMGRLKEEAPPRLLSAAARTTLQAVSNRVIPGCGFDLAARVEQQLIKATGDGWRYDLLPSDADAWKQGLRSLDLAATRDYGVPFVALDGTRQDELLSQAQTGNLGKGMLGLLGVSDSAASFTGAQMSKWFEDVRGDLTRLYVSDPRAMERINFTGFADEAGFTEIRLGDRERSRP